VFGFNKISWRDKVAVGKKNINHSAKWITLIGFEPYLIDIPIPADTAGTYYALSDSCWGYLTPTCEWDECDTFFHQHA
jgi:hypothetical protein